MSAASYLETESLRAYIADLEQRCDTQRAVIRAQEQRWRGMIEPRPAPLERAAPPPASSTALNRRGPKRKYPFPDMQIGDSFKVLPSISYNQVLASIRQYRYSKDRSFHALVAMDGDRLRVWRVAGPVRR